MAALPDYDGRREERGREGARDRDDEEEEIEGSGREGRGGGANEEMREKEK